MTELRMTSRTFWNSQPRKIVGMLKKSKDMQIEKMKVLAYLINGGKLEETKSTVDPFDF